MKIKKAFRRAARFFRGAFRTSLKPSLIFPPNPRLPSPFLVKIHSDDASYVSPTMEFYDIYSKTSTEAGCARHSSSPAILSIEEDLIPCSPPPGVSDSPTPVPLPQANEANGVADIEEIRRPQALCSIKWVGSGPALSFEGIHPTRSTTYNTLNTSSHSGLLPSLTSSVDRFRFSHASRSPSGSYMSSRCSIDSWSYDLVENRTMNTANTSWSNPLIASGSSHSSNGPIATKSPSSPARSYRSFLYYTERDSSPPQVLAPSTSKLLPAFVPSGTTPTIYEEVEPAGSEENGSEPTIGVNSIPFPSSSPSVPPVFLPPLTLNKRYSQSVDSFGVLKRRRLEAIYDLDVK